MEATAFTVLVVVTLFHCLRTASACNGYEMKINSFKNCNSNNVLQFKDITATLDKDCNVIPSGCVSISKTIKSAKGHYKLRKPPMPAMEGEIDLCDVIEDDSFPEIAALLSAYGVTNKCPVPGPKKVCPTGKKVSIAKYKNQLGLMVGTTDMKLEIAHDGGSTTCVEMNLTFKKK